MPKPAGLGALAITVSPPPTTLPATREYREASESKGTCDPRHVSSALCQNHPHYMYEQRRTMVYRDIFWAIQNASAAPPSCAAINPGAPVQRIPENESVRLLAMVTAGLAKDVDDVHQ
jgi:hypothetical protein